MTPQIVESSQFSSPMVLLKRPFPSFLRKLGQGRGLLFSRYQDSLARIIIIVIETAVDERGEDDPRFKFSLFDVGCFGRDEQ